MIDSLTDNPTQHPALIEADTCLQRGVDLHQAGQLDAAASGYRAALQQRPEFPAAWATLGLARMAAGALDEAEQHQREALRLDPTLPEAHNGLGLVHYQHGRVAEAENCFRDCLRLWPEHPGAHLNLAVALQSRGHLQAAEASYRDALRFGADAAQVCNNLSVLLREMGRIREAEAAVRMALRLRPDRPDAQVNLAMVLLLTGRWAEAWPPYEARWQIGDLAAQRRPFAQPLWTGEQPIAGKTILLHAEQGFGDTLQFCRYAPLVAAQGARVVLEVQPPLLRLLARLQGVAQIVATGDALPAFDLHCPLMSLPRALRYHAGDGARVGALPDRRPDARRRRGATRWPHCPGGVSGWSGPAARGPGCHTPRRSTGGARCGWPTWHRSRPCAAVRSCRCNSARRRRN